MRSYLKHIAVMDKEHKIHSVSFNPGVNVITGKSSTGKSAMIEIFDYCFGNSENTVPVGIITDKAELYFIVLAIESTFLILGRDPSSRKAFLKAETILPKLSEINRNYFHDDYFIPMSDFRKELGRHFGIDIEDTDEDIEDRKYRRNNAKNPRPSVRHFMSFMLQHQNLIANKHSLFYRFDESKKREQTIDQFKIFAGFVSQEYFTKKQELNELERKLKHLEREQNLVSKQRSQKETDLNNLLKEYVAVTGKKLFEETAKVILDHPAQHLEKIKYLKIITEPNSNEFSKQLLELEEKKNLIISEKRKLQIKLNNISASVDYAQKYKEDTENTSIIAEAKLHLSKCPFCQSKHEELVDEANSLEEAINWLNNELSKTPYLLDSFLSEQKTIQNELQEKNQELKTIKNQITKIENITKDLEKNKSLEEQGLKIKLKIETILEEKRDNNLSNLETEIAKLSQSITNLNTELREKFNPERKLRDAARHINSAMNQIGEELDFEKTYSPINLRFSLENFDLWHEKSDGSKVFLRSMGSGANWLYCHLALFTALHKYFCSLGNKCLIPPILFLDQPSQVYFPTTIVDSDKEFDAQKLKEKEGKATNTDEDLRAVTNFFDQLIKFCKSTLKETTIEPQIIITDHADRLKLKEIEFENLVNNRRWRTRGFIEE